MAVAALCCGIRNRADAIHESRRAALSRGL